MLWVIMKPQRFDEMEFLSPLPFPAGIKTTEEPHLYLPVFESREAAIKANGGSAENIAQAEWKIGAAGI